MMKKRVIVSCIFSAFIATALYYTRALPLSAGVIAVLKHKFDLSMCITVGVSFGVVCLIFGIRKPALSEADLLTKKQAYFYNNFSADEKAIVDAMSKEDKEKFYVSYEQALTDTHKQEVNTYLAPFQKPQLTGGMKALRKVALLAFVVFIGWCGYSTYTVLKPSMDAYYAKLNAKYPDQTLNIPGLPPIILRSDGTFKQVDINKFIDDYIKTQPAWLLSYAKGGISLNTSTKFGYYGDASNAGYAISGTQQVALNLQFLHDPDYAKDTVSHELCHLFDFAGTNDDQYSDSATFEALYNAAPASVSEYGATNVHEFFAEAGAMYLNQPGELKLKNIDVYNYFHQLFGQYQ